MTEEIKCGEIFRTHEGTYGFVCFYCTDKFENSLHILNHIERHFQNFSPDIDRKYDLFEEEAYETNQTIELKCTPLYDYSCMNEAVNLYNENISIKEEDEFAENECIPEQLYLEETFTVENEIDVKPKNPLAKLGKIVECDICGNRMKKSKISAHLENHANLRSYKCDICLRGYNTKAALQHHLTIHSTTKRFNCNLCGWLFHDKGNLITHMRIHTGEKPHKCRICNKAFRQSSYINIHMRMHTGEKPFKCSLCSSSFHSRGPLTQHMKIHRNEKNYACNQCDKKFYQLFLLKIHQRSHTGEKPFSCPDCDKAFSSSKTYRQHKVLHTGIKHFKCKYCDAMFAQAAGRRSHEKYRHEK